MSKPFSDSELQQLVARLPSDRPFTCEEAVGLGIKHHQLLRLRDVGLLRRELEAVYVWHGVPDSFEHRIACVKLVVPPGYVVVDRTAAWIWSAYMALAPNSHREIPPIDVFGPPGHRLRNGLTTSGERTLLPGDVIEVDGLRVTSQLRTACDLGRLLHPDWALAAMDALAATERFTVEELNLEVVRFKGMRGVIQLRVLAPFVDPRSGSGMESIKRKRWLDAGLPKPECQVPVPSPSGHEYAIDIGLPEEKFGGEFFGEEFHGPEKKEHDEARLVWLRDEWCWTLVVSRGPNVVGPKQDVEESLRREWHAHRTGAGPRIIDLSGVHDGIPSRYF